MFALNGIFPVYKQSGITSAQTLYKMKDIIFKGHTNLPEEKIKFGHGGILDHSASGVLVIGAGDDCIRLKEFLRGEKSYVAEAVLGTATDTYNAEGKVTMERSFDHIDLKRFKTVIKTFLGRIQQLPPLYSALKHKGERYSDLARKGIEVELRPRVVQCFKIDVLRFSPPFFTLHVTCGGGFYIRSLVHDVGLALDSCAHLARLERTQQGPFSSERALVEPDWSLANFRKSAFRNKALVNKYLYKSKKW